MGVDRHFLAAELGFKNGPSLNSMNSTGNRDTILDFLFASSGTFIGSVLYINTCTLFVPNRNFLFGIKLDKYFVYFTKHYQSCAKI